MQSFRDLEVWKKGMVLVKEIYRLTDSFPSNEQFGLVSQMRRSSTSILANLAGGFSRITPPDKSHKYTIARGEYSETAAFLLISVELHFLKSDDIETALSLAEEVGKMLTGLVQSYT